MKDYNFFEIYGKKRSWESEKKALLTGIVLILLCIALSAGLFIRNGLLQNQMNHMADEITQIQNSREYIKASNLKGSLDAMIEYDNGAQVALDKFHSNGLITTDLLNIIYGAIPSTVTLNSFYIDNANAQMIYRVPDRKAAAELVLQMKETNIFHEVHLSSVQGSTPGQGFLATISCVMKEGESE